MRATSRDFSLFHTRSLSEDSNKSEHLAVSLETLPNRKCEFVYRKLLSFRIAVQIRKVQTHCMVGRLRKAGMYPAFIYLSIYFFNFLFYLISFLFFFFLVGVALECKDVED